MSQEPLPNSLVQRLLYHAVHHPDHPALVSSKQTFTYAQLALWVTEQAGVLTDEGVSKQSVVGIRCPNDFDHMVLCLAATRLGAASCTIPSHETAAAQEALSKRCGVTHLVDASRVLSLSELNQNRVESNFLADVVEDSRLFFSTSGTTGEPKLVVHFDRDLVAQAHRHVSSAQERFACIASMEHNFAKRHRLYALAVGATNIFLDADSARLIPQCLDLEVATLHVSAFQAQELLAKPDVSKLAHIRLKLGGGHVPLELRNQLRKHITTNLQAGYGTTETGAIGFTDPADLDAGESVGQPLPGIEVRVVDSARKSLGVEARGEIAIRCEGMFREYLGNTEATSARLEQGWFYTGDIGYLDKQNRIHLCGRSDDMFVFNSMNIYPQDIESTILKHPKIADVAVIPKASSVHGSIPVALLVFKEGVKQRLPEVEKFVRKHVGVRSPRQYIIVPEIPKTAAGKISRSQAITMPSQSGEIRNAVLGMLKPSSIEHLKASQIRDFKNGDRDILLKDLVLDSLDRMNFLVSIELDFETVITPKEFRAFRYLGHIVAHIIAPPKPQEVGPVPASRNNTGDGVLPLEDDAYEVRFFKRLFRYCQTVAQLNKALTTLECRQTPNAAARLYSSHAAGRLLPAQVAPKFNSAVTHWLQELQDSMQQSGKVQPEPFQLRRVKPNICYFYGPGSANNKTLLICFPPREIRQMGIPNAAFLQHVDAQQYDVLLVSGPFSTGYRMGASQFKKELVQFSEWLKEQEWYQHYQGVRTLGFSAGARAAIGLGYLLNTELSVSVSGRLHRKHHLLRNFDQLCTIYRNSRAQPDAQVTLCYTDGNSRDRRFAKVVCWLVSGQRLEIRHQSEKLRHLIFQQLLEHGELAALLERTIFSEFNTGARQSTVISFPSADVVVGR